MPARFILALLATVCLSAQDQKPPEPVLGSEKIRTRGSADYVFLDLHLWLDPQTPLQAAHATSHVVKDKLMAKFPQLADVVIHIEPPPNHHT